MRLRGSLRVALCFATYPPAKDGGAGFLARFASSFAAAGHEVTVLTSPVEGPAEDPGDGVEVHRILDDWTLGKGGRRSLQKANRLLSEREIEVVHVFFPAPGLAGRYQLPAALGLGRIPLVTTFWNLGLGRRSPWALRAAALALIARSSVLTSHDPTYLDALRALSPLRRPVHWLPVGNNLGDAARPALLPSSGVPRVAYFGQIDFTRGVEDLFEAFRVVRRSHDARLVMIGSAGREGAYLPGSPDLDYYREVRALPARLGIADVVEWTEYLPDAEAAALLGGADVCVLPYRRNSLGRSALVAALDLGVPTVLAGTEEAVAPLRAGTHVVLVPRRDPEALAEAVSRLLCDPSERARLARGAKRAARIFSWPRIAAAAQGIYREALSARAT